MKIKITIKGKVHGVGYRVFLFSNAFNFGIRRFNAYNSFADSKEAVLGFVEADRKTVDSFLDFVRENKPVGAEVEEILTEKYEGEIGDINTFASLLGFEQLNKGVPALLEMRGDIKEIKGDTKEMKGDIKEVKGDIKEMLGKQNELLEVTKTGFELITAELRGFRELHEEVRELRLELNELKGAVARIEKKVAS